jgi:hypothetical protein
VDHNLVILFALGIVGFWFWRLEARLFSAKTLILERLDELESTIKESIKEKEIEWQDEKSEQQAVQVLPLPK